MLCCHISFAPSSPFVELWCARGRNGLCFDSKLDLWHYSTFQSGAGKGKEKREKKRKLRLLGGSGRPGLELVIKSSSVWAAVICSRSMHCQLPSAGGCRGLCGWWGLPAPTLLGFQVLLSLSDGPNLNSELSLWYVSFHMWPTGSWCPTLLPHSPCRSLVTLTSRAFAALLLSLSKFCCWMECQQITSVPLHNLIVPNMAWSLTQHPLPVDSLIFW